MSDDGDAIPEQLRGATLIWKPYGRWSESWDHDHCGFCWAKFVEAEDLASYAEDDHEMVTEGYAAQATGPEGEDDYHWICASCFEEFKWKARWKVIETTQPNRRAPESAAD
jgi:hypothetical protein